MLITAPSKRHRLLSLALGLTLVAAACGSSETEDATLADDSTVTTDSTSTDDSTSAEETTSADDTSTDDAAGDTTAVAAGDPVDVGLFFDGALAEEVTTEPCTLSGGAETTCYVITVSGDPVTYETGPFCPTSTADTADDAGIWIDGNGVYDLDGEFITNLAEFYGDDNWMMFDEDGNVFYTETAEEFELAARPDVDESLQNHCVEGTVDFLENGEPITTTVMIPVEPVLSDGINNTNGNLGVTLDGVVVAASAPVDAILSAYTIAAFDDCGGHYNPFDGYHLHGATGCSELEGDIPEGETAMFGYALDGFPVHSPLEDPESADLDECGGHETEELGYHYHANDAGENLVITCLIGQTVATEGGGGGGGGGGERPEGPPPGEDG